MPQPATPLEPVDFETAKGTVAAAAGKAREVIRAYLAERYGDKMPEMPGETVEEKFPDSSLPKGFKILSGKLGRLSDVSMKAQSVIDWQKELGESGGSTTIGAMFVARLLVEDIRDYDQKLPPGSSGDAAGSLTREGLGGLINQMDMAISGLQEHVIIEGQSKLKPRVSMTHSNTPTQSPQENMRLILAPLLGIKKNDILTRWNPDLSGAGGEVGAGAGGG